MSLNINTVISALDKPSSLTPFFVKDAFDVTGRTVMANKESGKHEAREKFIEEAGTSAFWIGGIPVARWLGGKIAKWKANINPNIHFKRINTNGIQGYFADEIVKNGKKKFSAQDLDGIVLHGSKNGALENVKSALKKNNYKKFHVGLTAASVLTNLVILCVGLPKFNQYLSRKIIAKEHAEQQKLVQKNNNLTNVVEPASPTHAAASANISTKNTTPTSAEKVKFGHIKDLFKVKSLLNFTEMAENAQLEITSSMLLLDYGISGSRVTFVPRDNNERVEYVVKEGGIILFFYHAADWIKKGFEKLANEGFKTPIDLDYKIINDHEFAQQMKDNKNKTNLFHFAKDSDEISVIKFIDQQLANTQGIKNKDEVFKNFTLKMAQKSGLVDIEYDDGLDKWIRHSEKYIQTDKVADLNKNLKNFWEQGARSGESNIEKVISKTKKVKGLSTLGNIAICCAALSYALPKIQYMIREHRTQTKAAPGIKVYQELAEKNLI